MANITIQIDAEDGPAVAALANLQRSLGHVEDKVGGVSRAASKLDEKWERMREGAIFDKTAESARGAETATSGLASSVVGVATSVVGIGVAAKTAADAFEGSFQMMKERAQAVKDVVDSLEKTLAAAGEISLMPEVRKQLSEIGAKTLDPQQMAALYAEISKQGGVELDPATKMQATAAAARAADRGVDSAAYGKTYAELAKTAFQGSHPAMLEDITSRLMTETAGAGLGAEDVRTLNRSLAVGVKPEKALELIVARQRGDESSRAVEGLLQAMEKGPDISALKTKSVKDDPFVVEQIEKLQQEGKGISERKEALQRQRKQLSRQREDELDALEDSNLSDKQKRARREDMSRAARVQDRAFEDELETLDTRSKTIGEQTRDLEKKRKVSYYSAEQLSVDTFKSRWDSQGATEDRLRMIMEAPQMFGLEDNIGLKNLSANTVVGMFADVAGQTARDESEYADTLRRDPTSKAAHRSEAIRVRRERAKQSEDALARQNMLDEREAIYEEAGFNPVMRGFSRTLDKVLLSTTGTLPGLGGGNGGKMEVVLTEDRTRAARNNVSSPNSARAPQIEGR